MISDFKIANFKAWTVPDCSWPYLIIPDCFWPFLIVLFVDDCPWLFLIVPDRFWPMIDPDGQNDQKRKFGNSVVVIYNSNCNFNCNLKFYFHIFNQRCLIPWFKPGSNNNKLKLNFDYITHYILIINKWIILDTETIY